MDIDEQKFFTTATKMSPNVREMDKVLTKLKLLPAPDNLMTSTIEFINHIAQLATDHKPHLGEITRVITDEFSFYPKDRPFTIDEYKALIKQVSIIAQRLPPDTHLVLATFPVVWPDGVVDNCGLYVQSPKHSTDKALVHHFFKENHSQEDIVYRNDIGQIYPLRSNRNQYQEPNHFPAVVLSNTDALQNDVNQFRSALKIVTSDKKDMMVTLGICFDHSLGVEREAAHGLIEQLKSEGQSVPLHCSHVITSSSITTHHQHLVSTITHADPNPSYREPHRSGFTENTLESSFSGQVGVEIYPAKAIGFIHSDLFQHAVANEPAVELTLKLNNKDETGNTLLHQAFSENIYDRDLIARRLYSMIIHGGDPDIKNLANLSVRDLAMKIEQNESSNFISRVIDSALEWQNYARKLNTVSPNDQQLVFTRLLTANKTDAQKIISTLIQQGANPYQKNGLGQSAMDIIKDYSDVNLKNNCLAAMKQSLESVQYGYFREGQYKPLIQEKNSTIEPYDPDYDLIKPEVINKKHKIQSSPALIASEPSWFTPLVPKNLATFNVPTLQEKIDAYLIIVEKIKSNDFLINDIYPAVSHLVNEIKALFSENESKYKLATDTVMQLIENRFIPSLDLDSHAGKKLENNTLESFIFAQLNDNLTAKINQYEDLKFIQYLQPDEKNTVLQLVNKKISDPNNSFKNGLSSTIKKIADIELLKELSIESLAAIFSQIKHNGQKIHLPPLYNVDNELTNQHVLIHLINIQRLAFVDLLPQLLEIVEPPMPLDSTALMDALDDINFKKATNIKTYLANILNNLNETDILSQQEKIKTILSKLNKHDYSSIIQQLNPALQQVVKLSNKTLDYKQQVNEMKTTPPTLANNEEHKASP